MDRSYYSSSFGRGLPIHHSTGRMAPPVLRPRLLRLNIPKISLPSPIMTTTPPHSGTFISIEPWHSCIINT
ncbi:hypothetical protein PM082_016321 [Marasmius tenuissimus]|nr:hypothetical protein PM082_016321 [Marasmius tenuissimus]